MCIYLQNGLSSGLCYSKCVLLQRVSPTSHYEVGVGEEVLGLHECTSVSRVEQVKDAIRVHSDGTVH